MLMNTYLASVSRPDPGAMSILISHSNALVSAGVVATMQKLSDCEIHSSTDESGFDFIDRLGDFDLVIADADSLRPSTRPCQGASPERAPARPQIVLLTATMDDVAVAQSLPDRISACLPLSCGQDDLLRTVCNLIGTKVAPRPTGALDRPGNAASIRSARPRGGIAPSTLQRIRAHIEQNLGERIEIGHLAAMSGLSTCHFSRAFKQSVGVPPHRYLLSRRVLAAAALVRATDRPMSEIALEVGFSDQSHFTRVFTAHIGESPRRFRYLHR